MNLLENAIVESLNSKVNLKHDDGLMAQMITTTMGMIGHKNVSVHTDGTDMYSTSKKNDAIEIHHFNMSAEPGSLIGDRPNPQFVSNIKHLASPFLEAGSKVRFVTSDHAHNSIKRLTDRMNRYGEYTIRGFDTPDPEAYGAPSHIKLMSLEIQKSK